ncbi:MAG: ABC transporter ATP-binding protein [DPANN group archaeon]|nr:ABC transporter ATP-binding protein [DPANN group archaeon]
MVVKSVSENIVELKKIEKIYKMGSVEVSAIKDVSFSIKKGKFIIIMGPSGSGKSTLMNMVGCLDVPTKGQIYLDGHDISTLEESDLAQIRGRKIGFVFQKANLLQTATAFENVTLPMIFQNTSKEKREKRAKELLKIVGLEKRMYHKPSELSGGEQQRVAIARALANNPEMILADEPTGNLDSKTGREILDFFKKLNKEGKKTIVMVTHDPSLYNFGDRVIYIKDGQVSKDGIKVSKEGIKVKSIV